MFSLTFQKSLQTLIFLLKLYAFSSQKTLPLELCATVFIQTQRSDVYGTSHDKILPQSKLLFVKTFKYALKLNIYMMFFQELRVLYMYFKCIIIITMYQKGSLQNMLEWAGLCYTLQAVIGCLCCLFALLLAIQTFGIQARQRAGLCHAVITQIEQSGKCNILKSVLLIIVSKTIPC